MTTKQAPGWHKEDIKAAIRKRGKTMTQLAYESALNESTVRNALVRPVLAGEQAISAFLGIPAHELWPERWTIDGRRIRPRYASKYNRSASAETVRNTA